MDEFSWVQFVYLLKGLGWTLVLSALITNEMTRYLTDKFNAGTPVKEDDGRLMWVGSVPWTSTIGVPYP